MKDFFEKTKNWYKSSSSPKISFEKRGIRPTKDWNMLLVIFIFIILILGGMSSYFYMKVSDGTFFVVEKEDFKTSIKINSGLLNKVMDDLKNRESLFQEVKAGEDIPTNPAL